MWKRLEHQNIVPFLGITPSPLQLISEWIPGGNLMEHIKRHPDADRLCLVGVPPFVVDTILTPSTSCPMSPKDFAFSTPATYFMVISRECVVVPNFILPPY